MFFLLLLHLPFCDAEHNLSINVTLLEKTLEQLHGYNIAWHYDNSQLEELHELLKLIARDQPMYLINYDAINENSSIPLPNQLLHVVFLKKTYDLKKFGFIDDLNGGDLVILVDKMYFNGNKYREMCTRNNIFNARAIFIIGESFSTCCYHCGEENVTLRTFQMEKGVLPDSVLNNKFRDFGGHTFKIGFEIYPPFFYNKSENKHHIFYGPESNILHETSKLLNYKYTLTHYTGNTTSGVKDIMIDEIKLGKIDWAIGGVSQTLMRTKTRNIEFTRYIQFQSYMVVYEKNEDNKSFANRAIKFWYISNWRSLLLIAGGVIGIAFVIKLSLKCSRKFSNRFGEFAIMAALYLVEQQSTKLKRNVTGWKPYIKLLFIFWLFISIYLLANYKSVQAYFLMTSQTGPNNIDDLVEKGYTLQIERTDFRNIKAHCQFLTSQFCSKMLKNLEVFESNVCASIKDVLNYKVALIQEEEPLKFTALRKCNLTNQQKQNLRFVPATVIPNEWHAWPFHKPARFIRAFSRLISRMESTGILRYWYTKEIHVYNNLYSNVVTEWRRERRPLNMSDFLYPFVLLIIGYFVCLMAYLKEMYEFRFRSNNMGVGFGQ